MNLLLMFSKEKDKTKLDLDIIIPALFFKLKKLEELLGVRLKKRNWHKLRRMLLLDLEAMKLKLYNLYTVLNLVPSLPAKL